MARPRCIEGELLRLSVDQLIVHTPLVKVIFERSGRPWPPVRYSQDQKYRSTVDLLRKVARLEISEIEISAVALSIFERFEYAKKWRRSRGLIPGERTSPSKELKKLRKIAMRGTSDAMVNAISKASVYVRDMLTDACGEIIFPIAALNSQTVLVDAIDKALNNPEIRSRPREFELDRCAALLIATYERFSGGPAGLANDPFSGRPVSKLHRFAIDLGVIYDIKIVSEASDDRLSKMMKNRTEFGHGEIMFAL